LNLHVQIVLVSTWKRWETIIVYSRAHHLIPNSGG